MENEIRRKERNAKERDAFFDAYESEWLKVFQMESGPKNFDCNTSTYIFCLFLFWYLANKFTLSTISSGKRWY